MISRRPQRQAHGKPSSDDFFQTRQVRLYSAIGRQKRPPRPTQKPRGSPPSEKLKGKSNAFCLSAQRVLKIQSSPVLKGPLAAIAFDNHSCDIGSAVIADKKASQVVRTVK